MDRNKELKKAYMEIPRPMGVFQFLNRVNGKRLVEASMNLDKEENKIRFVLRMGGSWEKELQADWNRQQPEDFVYEVLEELKPSQDPTRDYRAELETLLELWLEKLEPYGEKGYNRKKSSP